MAYWDENTGMMVEDTPPTPAPSGGALQPAPSAGPIQAASNIPDETGFTPPTPASPLGALQTTPQEQTSQVYARYDDNGIAGYYVNIPTGTDSEGGTTYRQMDVPYDQVKTTYQSNFDPETGSTWETPTYVVPQSIYQSALDKYNELYVPPPVDPNYKRDEAVQQSGLFTNQPGQGENINSFSGGYFGNIYDAINSGSYKVSPDKSQLISP